MNTNETASPRFTPGSVPVAGQVKVYYSADIDAMGGVDAFMKTIGSDQPKSLPSLALSDEEWDQLLNSTR